MPSPSSAPCLPSPKAKARAAGFFYLVTIIGGAFAVMSRATFVIEGDPSATAAKILGAESLFRLTLASELIAAAGYVAVTSLLYILLRPVNRALALTAAFFSLTGIAIGEATLVDAITPLTLLKGVHGADTMAPEIIQALALSSLESQAMGLIVSLVFFGFYCLSIGYLIIRSKFLPSFIGLLMVVAGASYLIITFSRFLAISLPETLAPFFSFASLIGESSLMLWLLLVGLNTSKWEETARAANESCL